ncbi:MAG: MarR family transcriptional regulator, partial [Microbacteriaceae bacterium]|nr:MarR family transcriptional regulator [Microbacteriaceae bacterium]
MGAARAHRRRAAAALAPLGLHPGQELLLSILAKRGSATQVQLARILGVEPPTIAKMVGRLEAAGVAERAADPRD